MPFWLSTDDVFWFTYLLAGHVPVSVQLAVHPLHLPLVSSVSHPSCRRHTQAPGVSAGPDCYWCHQVSSKHTLYPAQESSKGEWVGWSKDEKYWFSSTKYWWFIGLWIWYLALEIQNWSCDTWLSRCKWCLGIQSTDFMSMWLICYLGQIKCLHSKSQIHWDWRKSLNLEREKKFKKLCGINNNRKQSKEDLYHRPSTWDIIHFNIIRLRQS